MIKRKKGCIEIYCDASDCDSSDEIFIDDLTSFKELVRDDGWHLRRHGKCVCMDCWDSGKRV